MTDVNLALDYAKKAIDADPFNLNHREYYAELLYTIKRYKDAEKIVDEGLNFAPEWAKGYMLLAKIKKHENLYEKAEEYARKALLFEHQIEKIPIIQIFLCNGKFIDAIHLMFSCFTKKY